MRTSNIRIEINVICYSEYGMIVHNIEHMFTNLSLHKQLFLDFDILSTAQLPYGWLIR